MEESFTLYSIFMFSLHSPGIELVFDDGLHKASEAQLPPTDMRVVNTYTNRETNSVHDLAVGAGINIPQF